MTILPMAARSVGSGREELPLDGQTFVRHRADLGVLDGVHFAEPRLALVLAVARSVTLSSSGIMRSDFT